MKNRYGNEYWFEPVGENKFRICGDLNYWRYGGKEGEPGVNYNDLGFVDPSGGPFITAGYGIDGRKVVNIAVVDENIVFTVE